MSPATDVLHRIERKSPEQLAKMRRAGLVVADALAATVAAVEPGVPTAHLDEVAARVIAAGGASPSFLGYHGYPATICVSVNDEVVHGIPGPRVLRDGDLVSIDCGAIVDHWHGDAAVTVAVGEVRDDLLTLSQVARDALWAGIAAARAGGRLSDIGAAVERTVRGAAPPLTADYDLVRDYAGHGIGTEMHMAPWVANVGPPGRGPRLRAGAVLAIEPMVTLGPADVELLADDWTVATVVADPAAHWEHTVAITEHGPWVLTAQDGGAEELARLGVATPAARLA